MKFESRKTSDGPEIEFTADVRARELHFEEVPNPAVSFPGDSVKRSDWLSERENLPDKVRGGAVYQDARVRLLIAGETTDDHLNPPGGLEKSQTRARLDHSGRETAERKIEHEKERK